VPASIGWPETGGFPEVFTTAHDALFTQCGLTLGERVCVRGAAGGVGIAGVQLAVAAGAQVVATVRNEALRPVVAGYGPEVVAPDGFVSRGPYDVILELVGAPNIPDDIESLSTRGRIAVIGVGAGTGAEINLHALMGKRARIHGSTLRPRPLEQKATAAQLVEKHVVPLLADARVQVPIAATFLMRDAEAAYERFAAGGKLGKIVLLNANDT
jgi:NADPH:quinone reductase-like Zn-dependent oxidoreductase